MAVTPQTLKCHHNLGCPSVVTFGSLWCHSHELKLGINSFNNDLVYEERSSKSVGYWADNVTLPFDHAHDIGLELCCRNKTNRHGRTKWMWIDHSWLSLWSMCKARRRFLWNLEGNVDLGSKKLLIIPKFYQVWARHVWGVTRQLRQEWCLSCECHLFLKLEMWSQLAQL